MFIEIWEKPDEKNNKESFDFFFTSKRLNSDNEFIDLRESIPQKVLNIIKKENIQLIGHASFQKEGETFDSSAFFPFGESFSEYLTKKKSGRIVPRENLYLNLKGLRIPEELNKKLIKILEVKYPESFIIHKNPNKHRKRQLSKFGIKKGEKYPISEYKEKISRDLQKNDKI